MQLESLSSVLPDYAKDIRLNLSSVLTVDGAPDLSDQQINLIALSVAYVVKNLELASCIQAQAVFTEQEINAAKSAATIMAMNNIYYRFVHLAGDKEFTSMPAKLRMNVIGNPGIDKIMFEMMCLAASAINGCEMCINAHTNMLMKAGVSKLKIQSIIRITAVLNAFAVSMEIM